MILIFLNIFTFITLICSSVVIAAPTISDVTISSNGNIYIYGTNFGVKNPAKPLLWADFEDGTINPATQGIKTAWTAQAGVNPSTILPHSGSYCAQSDDLHTNNEPSLEIDAGDNLTYGQKYYISLWRRVTYLPGYPDRDGGTTGFNLKWLRIWNNSSYNVPDIWIGQPYDGWRFWAIESCNAGNIECNGYSYPDVSWRNEEFVMQMSSASASLDAKIDVYINGVQACNSTTFRTNCVGEEGVPSYICIQDNESTVGSMDAGSFSFYDSIYIDTTWQRVIIGNASTLAASTHREVQIPTAWDDNSISTTINTGSFQNGDSVYVFVVDSDGATSAGYGPIVLGKTGESKTSGSGQHSLNGSGTFEFQ